MNTKKNPSFYPSFLSAVFFIGIWGILSLVIDQSLILPSPLEVVIQTKELCGDPDFLYNVGATVLRGLIGFGLSFLLALFFGILSGLFKGVRLFLAPFLITMRSVPVLSFILIALIWFKTDTVPIFICFLVSFPIITGSISQGIQEVDPDLLEMSKIYRKSFKEGLLGIYLPSICPYLESSLSVSLGLIWKSIVAAEILSLPPLGVGAKMQEAQFNLDTSTLFAWTLIIILISAIFDILLHKTFHFNRRRGSCSI